MASDLVRCHGTQTESQWLAWIRSALRSKWLRWRPRSEALILARRPYKGEKKSQKWEYKCAICSGWFGLKECEVDHHPRSAGSILSVKDIGEFCNNLFCEVDNLRVVCKECHACHTLQQRLGITFEEAQVQRKVNQILKKSKKELLAIFEMFGYHSTSVSNADKRKQAVADLIKQGKL
jgi:hypothetical protein